jgi:hypothetical protein
MMVIFLASQIQATVSKSHEHDLKKEFFSPSKSDSHSSHKEMDLSEEEVPEAKTAKRIVLSEKKGKSSIVTERKSSFPKRSTSRENLKHDEKGEREPPMKETFREQKPSSFSSHSPQQQPKNRTKSNIIGNNFAHNSVQLTEATQSPSSPSFNYSSGGEFLSDLERFGTKEERKLAASNRYAKKESFTLSAEKQLTNSSGSPHVMPKAKTMRMDSEVKGGRKNAERIGSGPHHGHQHHGQQHVIFFVADFPIPASAPSYFFEVRHCTGSLDVWIGLIPATSNVDINLHTFPSGVFR